MKNKPYRRFIPLAILGVVSGLSLFTLLFTSLTGLLNINDLLFRIKKLPHFIIYWVGAANVVTFFPIFILGIWQLKPRGAVGYSGKLISNGIFRYLRNPMYSGLSFTLFGFGFLIQNLGVSLTGLFWLLICFFQVKHEEKELEKRFGKPYLEYKAATPRFIPNFKTIIFDLLKLESKKKKWKEN
jgi:protein-S-isoprenylcysteine O-methyltransferase Ste14